MAYGCVSTGLQLTHSPRQSSCHYATSGNWPFCSHNEYFYGTIISDSVASKRHIANSWVVEIVAFKIPTLSRAIWSPARNFYPEALLPWFPSDRGATELVAVQQKYLDCPLTSSQYNAHALLGRYFDSSLHCSQKLCIHLNLFKLWQILSPQKWTLQCKIWGKPPVTEPPNSRVEWEEDSLTSYCSFDRQSAAGVGRPTLSHLTTAFSTTQLTKQQHRNLKWPFPYSHICHVWFPNRKSKTTFLDQEYPQLMGKCPEKPLLATRKCFPHPRK